MISAYNKERVKFADELLFATETFYQTMNILRNHEGVLPCVTLGEIALFVNVFKWVKRSAPITLAVLTADKASLLVEETFVCLAKTQVLFIVLLITPLLCLIISVHTK